MMRVSERADTSVMGKRELLSWLNGLLKLNVQTIEDLSSGAAFCQLLDILHHGTVRMHKINWNAKLEHENLANLKLLTTAMHALNIDKKFDVQRIAQKKHQDILELLQWFRKHFSITPQTQNDYDPLSRKRAHSIQKNSLQNKSAFGESTSRTSQENIGKPKIYSIIKPELSGKKQAEDIIKDSSLKNCYKINKSIQKIVLQPNCSDQSKIQLIRKLFLQPNSKPELASEQPSEIQNIALKSSNAKTVANLSNKSDNQVIKLQYVEGEHGSQLVYGIQHDRMAEVKSSAKNSQMDIQTCKKGTPMSANTKKSHKSQQKAMY